jgi:membrane dipeptidase
VDDPETLHRQLTVVDAHSDILKDITDGHCRLGERFELSEITTRCVRGQVDLPRLLEGGVTAQVFALFVDQRYHDNPLRRALDMIAAFYRELDANPDHLLLATTSDDVRRAKREGKVAALLSLEGAEPLGSDLALLRVFYQLGVRLIGLTWNWRNAVADGWDASPRPGGLTPFGLALVEEMGRLGMIVDIAHLARPGFWQVMDAARGPVIGSHCVTWGSWHNLEDDQLRAVARAGGVICALGYGHPSLRAVVEQLQHIARIAGVDHVGFGADYFGLDKAPEGLEDTSKYPHLTAALRRAGFDAADVAKIMGGNLLRVFESLTLVDSVKT